MLVNETTEVVSTARLFLNEGWYTPNELRQMIGEFEKWNAKASKVIDRNMREIKGPKFKGKNA